MIAEVGRLLRDYVSVTKVKDKTVNSQVRLLLLGSRYINFGLWSFKGQKKSQRPST